MSKLVIAAVFISVFFCLHAYPTPDPATCIPQNEECDPEVTGFHYGAVQCCAWFQACRRYFEPISNTERYRCSPIYIGEAPNVSEPLCFVAASYELP